MNSPNPYRLCPKCKTRRNVSEPVCQMLIEQVICAWDLSEIEIQEGTEETQQRLPPVLERPVYRCQNGHEIQEGDLICADCGADIAEQWRGEHLSLPSRTSNESRAEIVTGWETISALPSNEDVRQQYRVRRVSDDRAGLLTVYRAGSQPDLQVYAALQNRVPREHIVELIEYGEFSGQYYDVTELIENGSLATMPIIPSDFDAVRRVVEELSTALATFTEVGLRHRTLLPKRSWYVPWTRWTW